METTIKSKTLSIYNANKDYTLVGLHDEDTKHCGVQEISSVGGDMDTVRKIRIMSNIPFMQFITTKFLLNGNNVPLFYFYSPFQFQQNLIDIHFKCKLDELNIQCLLGYMDYFHITLMDDGIEPDSFQIPEKKFFVVVKNESQNTKQLDLMHFASGGVDDLGFIKVLNNGYDISKDNVFNKIKIISDNQNQLMQPIRYHGERFNPNSYLTNNQFQANIIEYEHLFKIHSIQDFQTDILPYTTLIIQLT